MNAAAVKREALALKKAEEEEPQVLGGGGTARMAKQHLYQLATTAQSLHDKLDDDDELPEWCQSKIAVAESSIDAVAEHLGYKMTKYTGRKGGGEGSYRNPGLKI